MSYQVLARKWRPRFFREMVGQEHVLQALINALDHNRLHHAYLFTGTRGVGKTTIARILAKCLNCESGVTSEPCGQCSACQEINQGCFIDLIEVDAASRTKVEDTRELLDNVQYAPAKGRYKVYLIDEVHMLSTHSFNALLKTLEEPPEHVKFLLATTDPQKLPATILSRCLQFNLKNMVPERIVGHLSYVLQQEMLEFEDAALWALARSADGSMRDALSLTDQAIAFGSGKVIEQQVRDMLGSIDQQTVYLLAEALAQHDAAKLLSVIADFSEQAPDYGGVLDELLLLLHRMTIAQAVPDAIDNSLGDQQRVLALAATVTAEELQLFYQMGIMAKRDFALAPDLRSGLEMAVLRMLVFRPEGVSEPPTAALQNSTVVAPSVVEPASVVVEGHGADTSPADSAVSIEEREVSVESVKSVLMEAADTPKKPEASTVEAVTTVESSLRVAGGGAHVGGAAVVQSREPVVALELDVDKPSVLEGVSIPASTIAANDRGVTSGLMLGPEVSVSSVVPVECEVDVAKGSVTEIHSNADWLAVFDGIPFNGLLKSIAAECVLLQCDSQQWLFSLDKQRAQLYNDRHAEQIQQTLQGYFDSPLTVVIEELSAGQQQQLQTPALYMQGLRQASYDGALNDLQQDVKLQSILQTYSAEIVMSTVAAIDVEKGK